MQSKTGAHPPVTATIEDQNGAGDSRLAFTWPGGPTISATGHVMTMVTFVALISMGWLAKSTWDDIEKRDNKAFARIESLSVAVTDIRQDLQAVAEKLDGLFARCGQCPTRNEVPLIEEFRKEAYLVKQCIRNRKTCAP